MTANTTESILKDVQDTHGAAYAAAAIVAINGGFIEGEEASISRQVGLLVMHLSDVIRALTIESATGVTSNAMQELAAHLEACGSAIHEGAAVAKIYDREQVLNAICNAEIAGNALAWLAGMSKVKADAAALAAALSGEEPDFAKFV